MNIRWMRNSFIYLLIAVALIAIVFTMFSEPLGGSREVPVSQVISMSASGDVDVIEIDGDKLTILTNSGETLVSRKEEGASLVQQLHEAGVDTVNGRLELVVKGSSGIGSLFRLFFNFNSILKACFFNNRDDFFFRCTGVSGTFQDKKLIFR